ncbi:hypothetical protein ACQCSX_08750 [Pseudarthrobacter sp. P1]|uniref:hypothetical protein n=1 Tax=Pseudarthrobacter sp. P1 TaxID=3418418 RepID=UPI003CE7497C
MTSKFKMPATVRELGDMADAHGMNACELLAHIDGSLDTPAGYRPLKGVEDVYVGKRVQAEGRWSIEAQYVPHLDAFTLWTETHDADALTANEAIHFADALRSMAEHIEFMRDLMHASKTQDLVSA